MVYKGLGWMIADKSVFVNTSWVNLMYLGKVGPFFFSIGHWLALSLD